MEIAVVDAFYSPEMNLMGKFEFTTKNIVTAFSEYFQIFMT